MKVKADWPCSMINVLAKIRLDVEWNCWDELLSAIEIAKEHGWVKPLSFAFVRMYDETPQVMYSLGDQGQKQGGTTIAKVMASNLGFSMTLEVLLRPVSSCKEEGSARAAGADTHPLPISEFHVIHGGLGSTLTSMQDMTGPTTLHCIQRFMWMSLADQRRIEQLFERCIILNE